MERGSRVAWSLTASSPRRTLCLSRRRDSCGPADPNALRPPRVPLPESMATKERDYGKLTAELKGLNKVLESGEDSNGCKLKKTDDAIAVSQNAPPPPVPRRWSARTSYWGGANSRAWDARGVVSHARDTVVLGTILPAPNLYPRRVLTEATLKKGASPPARAAGPRRVHHCQLGQGRHAHLQPEVEGGQEGWRWL